MVDFDLFRDSQNFVIFFHDDVIKWKQFPSSWPFDVFYDLRLEQMFE